MSDSAQDAERAFLSRPQSSGPRLRVVLMESGSTYGGTEKVVTELQGCDARQLARRGVLAHLDTQSGQAAPHAHQRAQPGVVLLALPQGPGGAR